MKIYLAIPYTGHEQESFKTANLVAGKLMAQGHIVFSPISHTHPIAVECELPGGWDFWENFDRSFIGWCDELWVCDFKEYKRSKGVMSEIGIAHDIGKPVRFMGDA